MINKSKILHSIFTILVVVSVFMLYKNHVTDGDFYVFTNEETVPYVNLFNKEEMLSLVNNDIFNQEGIYIWNN